MVSVTGNQVITYSVLLKPEQEDLVLVLAHLQDHPYVVLKCFLNKYNFNFLQDNRILLLVYLPCELVIF